MKRIISATICFTLVGMLAVAPVKTNAAVAGSGNEQVIALLLQLITQLQAQLNTLLAAQTDDDDNDDADDEESESVASLRFSKSSFNFNYELGGTLPTVKSLTFTNTSDTEARFTIRVPNQPAWLNSGYATEELSLQPDGEMGLGALADPTRLSPRIPGKYETNILIRGNFKGSPKKIPVIFNVTDPDGSPVITDAEFTQGYDTDSGEAYVRVEGYNLGKVSRLEYSANCCKPIEGTLRTGIIGKDSVATFYLDTYLGNVDIQGLSVRVITTDNEKSDWFKVY